MSETAERLGSVMGTAHRQMRRGLELVRSHPAANAEQLAHEGIDRASRAMQQLEEEVYDVRRQAALKLDELSEQAEARFQQLRLQVIGAFSRSRERAEEVAARYPLQTIAAVAGVCFALGVTLRFRRPHRG
jgi:ElaB/YqjD/DUF883 family membrane-anchored ribosome-binding protein